MLSTLIQLAPLVVFVVVVYRRFTRTSVSKVPGPPSSSWLHGNLSALFTGEAGQKDCEWTERYGSVVKMRGPLGEDALLVSDAKAIHYILQNAYAFPKIHERRVIAKSFMGPGLVYVEGDAHKRHRKVMRPAFGSSEIKELLPVMSVCASSVSEKWSELIQASSEQSIAVNVPNWIARGAMDAIGKAAFDYDFGAVRNKDDPLSSSFQNLLHDINGRPDRGRLMSLKVMHYIPSAILETLLRWSPNPRAKRAAAHKEMAEKVASELVARKMGSAGSGKEGNGRDVMSIVVRANAAENPLQRMVAEETNAQLMTLMLAGHETTANSLTWSLFELCKDSTLQTRLREEIRAQERVALNRGDTSFSVQDFDAMPFLNAVIKETLRFDGVALQILRESGGENVLPLSRPITMTDGKVLHELPIPKGQAIYLSVPAYNRTKDIFGADAHVFNPDRWLDGRVAKPDAAVGVYGHLLTFSSGIRNCIGWRFAVQEMQTFLVEMINNFEFELDVPVDQIIRDFGGVMTPAVLGQEDKKNLLPLRIRVAPRDTDEGI